MNRLPWPVVLCAGIAIGGAGGWWLARVSDTQAGAGTRAARSGITAPGARAAETAPPPAPSLPGMPGADFDAEIERARADPARVRELLARYAAETQADRKGALLAVLGGVGGDEVLAFALRQAAGADPGARRDALALLAAFPPDRPEVRAELARQLASERDPGVQATLLEVLQPLPMAREDAAPVVARLAELAGSEDASVRAASVRQLAQWDGHAAGEAVPGALLDPDPRVRRAAIEAVGTAGLRGARVRDLLLDVAADAQAAPGERHEAILALEAFELDRTDFALLREAAASIPVAEGTDGP